VRSKMRLIGMAKEKGRQRFRIFALNFKAEHQESESNAREKIPADTGTPKAAWLSTGAVHKEEQTTVGIREHAEKKNTIEKNQRDHPKKTKNSKPNTHNPRHKPRRKACRAREIGKPWVSSSEREKGQRGKETGIT